MKINIPYNFTPRKYQLPILRAFDSGIKRLVGVWHRRAGKDKVGLNLMVREMVETVGIYYYFFPTYAQGRKILWEGIDHQGKRFLSHFPEPLIASLNNTEMKSILRNGSLFRVIGTDKIDDIVGTNPRGCIFSEYALQSPRAWDFIRPILRENGGWAMFLYTPRGANHGKTLYDMAKKNPDWYCDMLDITQTGVISEKEIEEERKSGMDEDLIQQEFYCSWSGSVQGSYYFEQIKQAREEGRITGVPYDVTTPVNTVWDLGIGDSTAIWFYQICGREVHFIDYLESQGKGLHYYVAELQKKNYIYGEHYAPHDIMARELGTGKSRFDVARELGIEFIVAPKLSIEDGINACRIIFNRCWFDEVKCEYGISALTTYHKQYDDKRKVYCNHPDHDWASHGADAFRVFGVTFQDKQINPLKSRRKYERQPVLHFNPMTV